MAITHWNCPGVIALVVFKKSTHQIHECGIPADLDWDSWQPSCCWNGLWSSEEQLALETWGSAPSCSKCWFRLSSVPTTCSRLFKLGKFTKVTVRIDCDWILETGKEEKWPDATPISHHCPHCDLLIMGAFLVHSIRLYWWSINIDFTVDVVSSGNQNHLISFITMNMINDWTSGTCSGVYQHLPESVVDDPESYRVVDLNPPIMCFTRNM